MAGNHEANAILNRPVSTLNTLRTMESGPRINNVLLFEMEA